jgi:hypothetical protein
MFDNRIAIEERPACQDYEELEAREAEFLDELDDLDDVTDFELLLACIAFDLAMDECWE